jgi:hypothetical protein
MKKRLHVLCGLFSLVLFIGKCAYCLSASIDEPRAVSPDETIPGHLAFCYFHYAQHDIAKLPQKVGQKRIVIPGQARYAHT